MSSAAVSAASSERRAELTRDIAALAGAQAGQARTQALREDAENALSGLHARLDQLKSTTAYQAVGQLADPERLVRTNERTAAEAAAELTRRSAGTARARADLDQAAAVLADLESVVSRSAAQLADHATAAGIGWQPADAGADGFAERAGARVTARLEAVRAVAAQASVRAAAHYDLAHSPAQHTVSALLLVWDGAQLLADDAGELSAVLGSPGTRRAAAAPATAEDRPRWLAAAAGDSQADRAMVRGSSA